MDNPRLTAAEALARFRAQWRRAVDPAERKRIEDDAKAVEVLAAERLLAK